MAVDHIGRPDRPDNIRTAYFAGLIDAEGWADVVARPWPNGAVYDCPAISVGMTEREPIAALQSYFDCGSMREQKKAGNRKTAFHWDARNRDALKVATAIRPYSITKAAALDKILMHYGATVPAKEISHEERTAYFAGLIDGDGYVALLKSHKTGECSQPCIVVNMTCRQTVSACKEFFGAGSVCMPTRREPWKQTWRWTVWHNAARKVAGCIRPYAFLKVPALDAILSLKAFDHGSRRRK